MSKEDNRKAFPEAAKWADAFNQIVIESDVTIDEDLMIGWFANVIEFSYDERIGNTQPPEDE